MVKKYKENLSDVPKEFHMEMGMAFSIFGLKTFLFLKRLSLFAEFKETLLNKSSTIQMLKICEGYEEEIKLGTTDVLEAL